MALSTEFNRFGMDDADDSQVARRPEQPDYTKKDFKRAAEDLHSCIQEALEFFPKFDAEFTNETKEIKKYGDEDLLNVIWEKKVQRFENGPRATPANAGKSPRGGRQQPRHGEYAQEEPSSSPASASGITVLQHRIHVTVESMLQCKYPEPTRGEDGLEIRAEEVHDFEDRIRKTAFRLYGSLGSISRNVQAFRRAIRDLRTMSQDLDLFPLNLWKADRQEPEYPE